MTKGKIINNEVVFEKMPLSVNIYQIKKKIKKNTMGLRIHIYAKLFIYIMQLKPYYHLEESQRPLIILNQKKKKSQRHEISSDFRYIICKFLNFNKYISFQIYKKK